jgi:hypothetical protein
MTAQTSVTRRLALLASTALVLGLAACQTAGPVTSEVFARPDAPLGNRINLQFNESDFRAPGLTSEARNKNLESYGFYEMGPLVEKRAKAFWTANGLRGQVSVIPKTARENALSLALAGEAVMTITAVANTSQRQGPAQERAYLQFDSVLFDKVGADGQRKRIWNSALAARLGHDEALGVLKTHRADAAFVDAILVRVLEDLAAKELITLPGGRIVLPPA